MSALVSGGESLNLRLFASLEEIKLDENAFTQCKPSIEKDFQGRGSREGEPSSLSLELDADVVGLTDDFVEDLRGLPSALCYFTNLRTQQLSEQDSVGGRLFQGEINLGPQPLGTLVYLWLVAIDGDQKVWWPRERAFTVNVEGVESPLKILQVAPNRGPASGGNRVLIRGEGFADEETLLVHFGATPLQELKIESPELISGQLGPGPSDQTVKITVQSAGRVSVLERAYTFTPPPEIHRLTPPQFTQEESARVLVTGQHFSIGDSQLSQNTVVNTETRAFEYIALSDDLIPLEITNRYSQEELELILPPRDIKRSQLILENPDGQRGFFELIRNPAPTLTAVSPSQGPDDQETWILLEGLDLRLPATVWFDGRESAEVQLNQEGTRARVLTPLHPGGLSDITWYNPDGQLSRLSQAYRFLGPPRVLDASPTVISRCGGGLTTLIGINLDLEMRVYFNGISGEVLEVNFERTEAIIRAPSQVGERGPIDLIVIGRDGRRDRSVGLLEYGTQPLIRSVEPREAPVWGGTRARLIGSDLSVGSLFTVDGRLVEQANFISDGCDSLVEVILPSGEGTGRPISAESNDGQFSVLPDAIDYISPLFEPPEGLMAGYTNITLRGLDLREGMRLLFNGVPPRAINRISDREWTLLTPSLEYGIVSVELRNTDGRGLISTELYTTRRFSDLGSQSLNADGECNHITRGDFNGDGNDDLIFAMGSSSPAGLLEQTDLLFLGDGQGLEAPSPIYGPGNGMNAYTGDLDADNDLDLLIVNLFDEQNFVLLNEGNRGGAVQWREDPTFPSLRLGPSYDGGIFDADGDGDLDLFFMQTGDVGDNQTFGPERLYLREGNQWLDRSENIDFDLDDVHDHDMIHGDLNNDGLDDVVIVVDNLPQSFPGASNRILLNRGEGRFERVNSPINNYPGDWLDVALADINKDGNLDILMPQDYIEGISVNGTPALAVFIGDGQGGFRDESFRTAELPPAPAFGVTPADLDNDGDIDLLVAVFGLSFGDGSVDAFQSVLLLNDGEGMFYGGNRSFSQIPFIPTNHFEVIDLDRDGRSDIVECAAESQSRIWRNE